MKQPICTIIAGPNGAGKKYAVVLKDGKVKRILDPKK